MKTNEDGFTLVELLAALSILMVVILLGGSIHMFGQRQFIAQTESASQNNDLNYALTVMTTELRKKSPEEIRTTGGEIQYLRGEEFERVFYISGNQLFHGTTVIADSVTSFIPNKPDNPEESVIADYIEISLMVENSTAGNTNKDYKTTIYLRGETNE